MYSWNNFSFLLFNTNVGVDQGSVLSSIISTIYLAPIIKTFKKRIKNLKEKIPTDILFFVNNSLLIFQEKSYFLSSSFLLCSYNIMLKILLNAGLVIEHNKSKYFLIPLLIWVNKENSMEFLLFSVYYLYNYYMVCILLFHLIIWHIMWHDTVTSCHVTVTMWYLWYNTFPYSFLCSKFKRKSKVK